MGLLRLEELHLGLKSSSLLGLDPLLVRPGILLLELQSQTNRTSRAMSVAALCFPPRPTVLLSKTTEVKATHIGLGLSLSSLLSLDLSSLLLDLGRLVFLLEKKECIVDPGQLTTPRKGSIPCWAERWTCVLHSEGLFSARARLGVSCWTELLQDAVCADVPCRLRPWTPWGHFASEL